jgi:methionyl-tRNA formyltransferase
MRWILCGKNDAGVACLEHLLRQGDEVWAIGVAGDDGRDGWQRSLRGAAERRGLRFDQPRRINAPEFVEALAAFRANALISIQYDQILRGNLFRRVGCPCLNFHFALLPRHRGVAPIAWAVFEGDAEAGVTLHHMVEDIDAGDVIARRAVAIGPEDTAREVYDAVSGACAELFRETYPFPAELLARRLTQDASRASYHKAGDFDFSRRHVDWTRPAAELQRWIRAMIFPPMQYPEVTLGGRRLCVTRIGGAVGSPVSAPAGEVVGKSTSGLEVAANGGQIRIRALADPSNPAATSEEILGAIRAGERFE